MRVIAVVNQKGGCGKTTTTINLAGCLNADGSRVLVVDLDPQAHATLALGVDPERLDTNLYEVLAEADPKCALREICIEIDPGELNAVDTYAFTSGGPICGFGIFKTNGVIALWDLKYWTGEPTPCGRGNA